MTNILNIMKSQIYTHKTKSGYPARIISYDLVNDQYPVCVAVFRKCREYVHAYSNDLKLYVSSDTDMDLVEVSPWENVPVDTKIYVRDFDEQDWRPRYFSHYADGYVYAFKSGATSWSASKTDDGTLHVYGWKNAKLAD